MTLTRLQQKNLDREKARAVLNFLNSAPYNQFPAFKSALICTGALK